MHLRSFQMEDYEAVAALWREAGLHLSKSDSRAGIARKLERDADVFLVAEDEGTIVGAVMGTYDGRRAWVNHLAVAAACRGHGLGKRLIEEMERRLRAKGCDKVNLLIEPDNAGVQEFYQQLGYEQRQLIFMQKWLG
ncbi:MAG: GNAT family acetyltransferase [Chloroflexi bacterium]|nr:GNAT family acetyltransferase [Chloroflexota bacterium]